MSETIERKCDSCKKELMFTSYSSEYYLQLSDVPMRNKGGAVFAMNLPRELYGSKHFCGITCIRNCINSEKLEL
jgi:hypothetical protein